MADHYFAYYDLPVSFFLDEKLLKRKYYAKSREVHPDHIMGSDKSEADQLYSASYNNKAYHTLREFNTRMAYILEIEGFMPEEGKADIPQEFLMDMMEVNEQMMELEFDFDEDVYIKVKHSISDLEASMLQEIRPHLEKFSYKKTGQEELKQILEYYFKQKYLWRIKENLDKFVSR